MAGSSTRSVRVASSGEIAAIDGGARTATGRAVEDSHVVAISPRQFNEVIDQVPELRVVVMKAMDERLARIDSGT